MPGLPTHPYLRFRTRMAHHGLRQFAASLKNSMGIIMLGFGQVLLGLLACIALPGLYAATLPWPAAAALVAAQVLIAAAPAFFLRKRLHPADVLQWSRPLPIALSLRWRADAAVAGIIVGPLAVAYAVSAAIWFWQWPDWLRPVAPQALALTAVSLLLGWVVATLVLAARAHMPPPRKARRSKPAPQRYVPRSVHHDVGRPGWQGLQRGFYYWHQLFWLPFWRAENVIGLQQSLLLLGAGAGVLAWVLHPPLIPAALLGMCASLSLLVLTDRGDKAVAEQIALLRPVMAAWPVRAERLFFFSILCSLLPGLCVMALFAALTLPHSPTHLPSVATGYSHTVAKVWLAGAAIAQIAIVSLRRLDQRGRVALVICSTLILTAIGSELWN